MEVGEPPGVGRLSGPGRLVLSRLPFSCIKKADQRVLIGFDYK